MNETSSRNSARRLALASAGLLCAAGALAAPPQSAVTPATLDPNRPLSPSALKTAMTVWQGREVSVGGHLWLFAGEEGTVGRELDLAPTPDADKDGVRARCKSFRDQPTAKLKRADPLVVRGVVEEANPYWNLVMLQNCSVVSTDRSFDVEAPADPAAPAGRVIPVAALHEAAFGWTGVEVSVVGRFWGGTYSSASDTTRFDLQDADGTKVGCRQSGKQSAPQSALDRREGVVVRGRVSAEMSFGSPQLEDCAWVNRD